MTEKSFGYILGTKISAMNFKGTIHLIDDWIDKESQKYVCVCNTHSLVTAYNNKLFKQVLDQANLCVPDGMPLVFALRRLGFNRQERVDGPNLMLELCRNSIEKKHNIFLYGGTEKNLIKIDEKLHALFPGIQIVGSISPPFRNLTTEEELEIENKINLSKADIIFISLGCPKQEIWMYRNRLKINGVMIGVGAAYDFILGDIKRPPLLFQKIGLEWVFRLMAEPRRLFKRYAYNNPAFILKYILTYKKDREATLFR